MNEIYLIIGLIIVVGFFVLTGLIGEAAKLDEECERDRIRNSIHKDAARNIGCVKYWEGARK